jgi:hypothetical protein
VTIPSVLLLSSFDLSLFLVLNRLSHRFGPSEPDTNRSVQKSYIRKPAQKYIRKIPRMSFYERGRRAAPQI